MQKKSSTFSVTRARIWGLFLRRVDNFQQVWVFNVLTKVLLGSVDYEQKPFHHKRLYYPNTSQHRYIVTAAHCVTKGQRVWVHIGDHDKTTSSETNSIRYQLKSKSKTVQTPRCTLVANAGGRAFCHELGMGWVHIGQWIFSISAISHWLFWRNCIFCVFTL